MATSPQRPRPSEHITATPAPLNDGAASGAPHRFAFLLVPRFSHIAFASAIEPLRMANMVARKPVFAALTCTTDGAPVVASNGVRTVPDHDLDQLPAPTAVFVCGPNPIEFDHERRLIRWLQQIAGRGISVGGIDTGSHLLARAGLLDGYRCTIHWQDLHSLTDNFPRIIASDLVFEIDRGRCTCSGGTAAMDMMLQLIAEIAGEGGIAAAAADLLVHERVRGERDHQRIPLRHRIGPRHAQLSNAVALMEANTEEPMRIGEIAGHLGLSVRQLERLFELQLDSTPTDFYMSIRLARARQLLRSSSANITDIACRCGFRSAAHFSRRYRQHFGIAPRSDRC